MSDFPVELNGAFTALITPFQNGSVDHEAYAQLVERQIDNGIDGLVPCGTTGEAATLSKNELLTTVETAVDAADGRVPIVAGTGSNDTEKTVETTRAVSKIEGVDAALVVTPYYNKPDQKGMYRHFVEVADRGGLPVVLYNVPGRTGVSLEATTVAKLAEHENIVAIKEASGDMTLDTEILEQAGDQIQLLSGDDFTTFPLVALGGKGCISVVSNLDPWTMSELVAAARDGDLETARRMHQKIQPLARALFARPNPVPTKTAAALLGWCRAEVRPPLYTPSEEFREDLRGVLDDYGLF
ncbi:MAG: 4-hydroxy-tetrahydrodipicolinate synthase [Bradymonadaceae bacterium]